MTVPLNDTAELIRACAQVYWLLRNFTIDSSKDSNITSAEFDQGMYGPDKDEWPGSPVGFSWDIEFVFKNGNEENISLDVTFESKWIVSAERTRPGKYGPEKVELLFEYITPETTECVSNLLRGSEKVIRYCKDRKVKNV